MREKIEAAVSGCLVAIHGQIERMLKDLASPNHKPTGADLASATRTIEALMKMSVRLSAGFEEIRAKHLKEAKDLEERAREALDSAVLEDPFLALRILEFATKEQRSIAGDF